MRRIAKNITILVLATCLLQWPLTYAQGQFDSQWPNTDFRTLSIDLAEITSGGPGKDGIPAVDTPKFVSPADAASWLSPDEPVILLRVSGKTRVYPLQIMTYHEIVNDVVGDVPVSVTFCPLCNASIAFDRRVNDRELDFGTTGLLRKSDLVMYDRQTESWWQQFSGTAIVGELTGTTLKTLPVDIVAFRLVGKRFPEAQVLSRRTGYRRPYGRNPYQGYDRIGQRPFLFFDPVDPRLPAMERVINVSADGVDKIYPFNIFEHQPVVNDVVGSTPVVVVSVGSVRSALDAALISGSRLIPSVAAYNRSIGGRVLTFYAEAGDLYDEQTKSRWNRFGEAISGRLQGEQLQHMGGGAHFAFAWLAFNPESEIYR